MPADPLLGRATRLPIVLPRADGARACARGTPAVAAWAKSTRLNPMSGLGAHREHPLVAQTWGELKQYGAAAATNLVRLLQ